MRGKTIYCCFFLIFVTTAARADSFFEFFEPVRPSRPFQVMVHRGAMHQAPENTQAAMEHVINDGFEWAEVDVRLSADGDHVLWHDETLAVPGAGLTALDSLSTAQLLELDVGTRFAPRFAGERILRLQEALEISRHRLNLYLDCKKVNPKKLAEEIVSVGMAGQVVVYGSTELAAEIRSTAGDTVAVMIKWRPEFGFTDWIDTHTPDAVEVDAMDVNPDAVRKFHARGIWVQAKVLGKDDHPETWLRMVEAGVNWLQTDLPEEVLGHCVWRSMRHRPVGLAVHRGTVRYAPENTLPAFQKAIRLGADFAECDVRTTADGRFFVLHDADLQRTTDGQGSILEHTADQIAALDAGRWFGRSYRGVGVPSLDAFLETMRGSETQIYLDAKDIAPEALAAALQRHGLVEKTVVYQSTDYLARLRAVAPALRRMPPLGDAEEIDLLVERVAPYAFDVRWDILSAALIEQCHQLGVKVFSDALWRHETVEDYLQAMEWGIDVIQTDHPVRVMRAAELWKARQTTSAAPLR